MVHREAARTRALGEEDSLLRVRVEGELERDRSREHLTGVRERGLSRLRSHTLTMVVSCDTTGAILER